jgi:hypothetical protein
MGSSSSSARNSEICGGVCAGACIAAGGEACAACSACAAEFVQKAPPAFRQVLRSHQFWHDYDTKTAAGTAGAPPAATTAGSHTDGWSID